MTIRSKSFSIILHGTVPMKVGAVLFIRGGRRISMSRYGSCETGRTEDSEGTERHLETPISLTGKRVKKEEPKTNNRIGHVFVLGSYWRRWGNAIRVHNILSPSDVHTSIRCPPCSRQPSARKLMRPNIIDKSPQTL